jgi:hypothetical protein
MVRLPEASTVPMPLSMMTPVAFAELQESVADCPFSIADGDTFKEIVAGGGGGAVGVGGGAFASVGAGAGAFFAHPVPEMSTASRIAAEQIYRSSHWQYLLPIFLDFLKAYTGNSAPEYRNSSNGMGV